MNTLPIVSGILFLFFFVQGSAQNTLTTRANSPENIIADQEGHVENFKLQLYRYETAMEDADLESLGSMHLELIKLMKEECDMNKTPNCDYHKNLLNINTELKEKEISYSSYEAAKVLEVHSLFSNFYDTMVKDLNCLKKRNDN